MRSKKKERHASRIKERTRAIATAEVKSRHVKSIEELKRARKLLLLSNGLATGATLAGAILSSLSAFLKIPMLMGIAVVLAGIAAYAAVRKLHIITANFLPSNEPKPGKHLQSQEKENHGLVHC